MVPISIYWLLTLLICGYALWRGRREERAAALVCVIASIARSLMATPPGTGFGSVETGPLLVDVAMLAAFVTLALQSNRFWPLWIAGLQLTSATAHILKYVDPQILPQAYGTEGKFWSYSILLILAIGTWRSHNRIKLETTPSLSPENAGSLQSARACAGDTSQGSSRAAEGDCETDLRSRHSRETRISPFYMHLIDSTDGKAINAPRRSIDKRRIGRSVKHAPASH